MNLGIICEFNPFHQGHKYLMDSIRKNENDNIICAMSGNFVQRGEFAVYDKYKRAKTALENGADLVIEIPAVCSTLSAQGFAKSGAGILESTGVCDALAFGAECDNIDSLLKVAQEIKERDSEIKEELKKGVSYPAARQSIVNSPILNSPNNILAIEYLTYTSLTPIAVKRIGKGHDSDDETYSASQIRKTLSDEKISSIKNCEKAVLYKLRTMTSEDFAEIDDVSEGLENRIVDAVRNSSGLDEIYEKIKTKRYTYSRIRRIILRSYLGITKNISKNPAYIHVLGFNNNGRQLLSKMKSTSNLPIITKYGDISALDSYAKELFEAECRYTDIYNLGYKKPLVCGTEQRERVIIL